MNNILAQPEFSYFITRGDRIIRRLPCRDNLLFTERAGHGVGLSQWGRQPGGSGLFYRQILRHYYGPEVVLVNLCVLGRPGW